MTTVVVPPSNPRRSASSEGGSSHPSSSAAATQSLQLLLREDKLLTQHELHLSKHSQEAAFSSAAALLQSDPNGTVKQHATEALAEVDRKLLLVQSLAERVSRTSPDAVCETKQRMVGRHDSGTAMTLSKQATSMLNMLHEGLSFVSLLRMRSDGCC